jgi:SAM-dependent methyltransferase
MPATDTPSVHPANAEQLRAWDGDEGEYWATHADRFDRAVAAYHGQFLEAAAVTRGERVLDVGCGTGQTARDAARLAAPGPVLGVDLSSTMLAHARQRAAAEGLDNVTFEQADAQIHPFAPDSFDVAISRTGSIFFGDLVAGHANVARALRSGGRMVLLAWQGVARQEWFRSFNAALAAGREAPAPPPDAPGPFSMADPDRCRAMLSAAGLRDVEIDDLAAGMWFGADADEAFDFVLGLLGWMLEGSDDADRARALDGLRSTVAAHETADGVVYESAMWLVRAHRP